jgi:hypothetical protein
MSSRIRLAMSNLFAAALLSAQPAFAAPNIPAGLNCTKAQIEKFQKSKDGKKCAAQGDQDLLNNSSFIHGIYCSVPARSCAALARMERL